MKYLILTFAGLSVTLGLFYFMSTLIRSSVVDLSKDSQSGMIDFVRLKRDSNTNLRKRQLPKKPPPPQKAPPVPKTQIADAQDDATPDDLMAMPNMDLGMVGGGGPFLGRGGGGARNSDADETPLVRISPRYPTKAAMRGIEGSVVLSFIIDKSGSPSDVEIVKAKPPRIFDKAARRALLKWKYKPRLAEGKAIDSDRLTVELEFKLDKN